MATIAAWSSWSHMVHIALRFGERPEVAYTLPISVDDMVLVASTAMVEAKRRGHRARWSAQVAFTAGVATSVAANIAAAHPSTGARIVAAWPALALLLVVEMLSRAKRRTDRLVVACSVDESRPASSEYGPATSNSLVPPAAPVMDAPHRPAAVANDTPETGRAAATADAAGPDTRLRRPTGRSRRVADAVVRLRAERPDAPLSEIASAAGVSEAGVSERHVRRLLASPTAGVRDRSHADGDHRPG